MPTQNLLRFVTVANVDDEDRVGNSLLHTSGVQARFLSWSLVTILPLIFCSGYEVES